ncbi:uncharacterized protein LOC117325815 [Pecten maximus]|uniref:uncharacterized protein LOC117325815 n=1 Tax=Pecten maximus TaxID=6579 RepID=UPI001458C69A|nr:uncharacterized protein LOC117325815 [Pecten maximus]
MGSRSSKSTEKEILSQDQEEEEEPEREQYVAPRGTFPMGIGPYAILGKPRKRPETKIKKRKTPKPEAETIEELLISDSEVEEEEEEEDDTEQENNIRLDQTPIETPMATLNDELNEENDSVDDDDSDIEFGSQFSGMNKLETGPDILFVKPDTNLPAKEIVGQGKHQYGQFPMSFSPVQSEVDLHAATIASEIRDTMEYLPGEDNTDTGLNAYFEAQMTKDQPTNKDDGGSFLSDSEEEEDTAWMEDGRTNKQLG